MISCFLGRARDDNASPLRSRYHRRSSGRRADAAQQAAEVLQPSPSGVGCPRPAFVRLQLQGTAFGLSPNFNSVTPLADRSEGLIWVVIFSTCLPVLQCSLCWVHATAVLAYSTAHFPVAGPPVLQQGTNITVCLLLAEHILRWSDVCCRLLAACWLSKVMLCECCFSKMASSGKRSAEISNSQNEFQALFTDCFWLVKSLCSQREKESSVLQLYDTNNVKCKRLLKILDFLFWG